MLELPELRAAADTKAGVHIERMLNAAAAGELLSMEALSESFVLNDTQRSVELAHSAYMSIPPLVGGSFTVRGYYDFPVGTMALIDTDRGPWNIVCVADADDGRILASLPLTWPAGAVIREVTEADRAVLEVINRESPILMGERQVVYDAPDIFAAERLMGSSEGFVVEVDGEPIALSAAAYFQQRIGDEVEWTSYVHRTRVSPSGRGGGARGGSQWATFMAARPGTRAGFGMMHRDNAAIIRLYPPALITPVEPERLSFNIASLAVAATPLELRTATSDDASRIVDLLNQAHDAEQLFLPYTVDSLTERLSRDPSLYSWGDFRISERAVIGVWSGAYRVERTGPDGTEEEMRALVLDYGFEAGAEDDFLALLRATCAELAERGDTELTLFSSPPSPGYDLVRPLASLVDGYALIAGGLFYTALEPGPVYIDQIYF